MANPEVLTAATTVCRECGELDALAHVVESISAYLDVTKGWDLVQAATRGHVKRVKCLLESRKSADTVKLGVKDGTRNELDLALEAAVTRGHIHVIKALMACHQTSKRAWLMEIAAVNGHLEVLELLKEGSFSSIISTEAMDGAAVNGHLHVVQWLHAHSDGGCTTRAMDQAARNGRLDIIRWLHANRREGCTTQAVDWAAGNGHAHVVEWLLRHRQEGCSPLAIRLARENGHEAIATWIEALAAHDETILYPWKRRAMPKHHFNVFVEAAMETVLAGV